MGTSFNGYFPQGTSISRASRQLSSLTTLLFRRDPWDLFMKFTRVHLIALKSRLLLYMTLWLDMRICCTKWKETKHNLLAN